MRVPTRHSRWGAYLVASTPTPIHTLTHLHPTLTNQNPFGAARPRESVLAQRTGVSESDVLATEAKASRLHLRLDREQRMAKEEAEAALETAKATAAAARGGTDADTDADAADVALAEATAKLATLMDSFETAAVERALAGDGMRPSERRRAAGEEGVYGSFERDGGGGGGGRGDGDRGGDRGGGFFGGREFRDPARRSGDRGGRGGGDDYASFGGGDRRGERGQGGFYDDAPPRRGGGGRGPRRDEDDDGGDHDGPHPFAHQERD